MKTKKLVIAGGGAAGFFAAINAAALCPNLEVVILEKTHKLLTKVRISGGGRCNVTHACFDAQVLTTKYPRGKKELMSGFYRFNTNHTIEWFAERGIQLHTEEDGRMFPESNSSASIINCFLEEAEKCNVIVKTGVGISGFKKENGQFIVELTDKTSITSDFLLVATGGSPSIKNYQWIENSGHKIVLPLPSLFTFNVPHSPLEGLEGVSVTTAEVLLEGTSYKEKGPVLITHWGISGPAAIRLSAWAAPYLFEKNYKVKLVINFLPALKMELVKEKLLSVKKNNPQRLIQNKVFDEIPSRLWERICSLSGVGEKLQFANMSNSHLNTLTTNICHFNLNIDGKTTYKDEFVTCGGVELKDIHMSTLESKLMGNLFFAGEVLNVDGITGGFNFQAAWTTAYLAATEISKRC